MMAFLDAVYFMNAIYSNVFSHRATIFSEYEASLPLLSSRHHDAGCHSSLAMLQHRGYLVVEAIVQLLGMFATS